MDVTSALRALSRLRRAFDDNVEARSLHEGQPIKFMPSEAELFDAASALRESDTAHRLHSTLPLLLVSLMLCYSPSCALTPSLDGIVLVRRCVSHSACSTQSLCSALLSAGVLPVLSAVLLHDNADIGNAAVDVCCELLDDDTLREMHDSALQQTMQQLVPRAA